LNKFLKIGVILLIIGVLLIFLGYLFVKIIPFDPPLTQGHPNIEASSAIKQKLSFVDIPIPMQTKIVIFSKRDSFLDAVTIANQTGATVSDRLCLDISPDLDEGLFERQEEFISYKGDEDFRTKLLVICDHADRIDETIDTNGISETFPNCTGKNESYTICFISIIPKN